MVKEGTLQESAKAAAACFEQAARPNGDKFYRVKDGSPQWVTDMVREAHGTDPDGSPAMLPDDYRYGFVVEALDALVYTDDLDDARDSLQPDDYTSSLTQWLGSHGLRPAYVDQAIQDGQEGMVAAIAVGQLAEMQEVFDLVVNFLQALDLGDEEDEEA